MTRMLSELLGAKEPNFRLSLRALEKSAMHPSADIALSVDIIQQTRLKIRELGLDPGNTTGEELFVTLNQRLMADDQRLRESLNLTAGVGSAETLIAIKKFIDKLDVPKTCFALKFAAAKKLLKKMPPTKAMKHLGYRSVDSMLKREPVPQIYAAAAMYEPKRWHEALDEAYGKLKPGDFEVRKIDLGVAKGKRWDEAAADFASSYHHNSLVFKELGAVVLLPAEVDVPALTIATTLLSLRAVNDIRSNSSFLKLQQVKPNFGRLVAHSAVSEPLTQANLVGFTLPWRFLHGFFASHSEELEPALFEPHVQPEDLKLAQAEQALSAKLPALEFWLGTENLALIENGRPVSLNMLDVALNTANGLSFEERIAKNVQGQVWFELLSRYLNPQNLEGIIEHLSEELTGGGPQPDKILEEVNL